MSDRIDTGQKLRRALLDLLREAGLGAGQLTAVEALLQNHERLERQRLMSLVGRLSGTIAHGFSNQLQIILGYASRLGRDLPPGQQQDHARTVVDTARHSSHLVRRLLSFSRRSSPAKARCNGEEELQVLLSRFVGEARLRLEGSSLQREPHLRLSAEDFEQILLPLLDNAREAGARTIVVSRGMHLADGREPTIFGPPLLAGDFACITLEDDGRGIEPALLPRVFDPFCTTKPASDPGAGLGLSIAYNLLGLAGGDIAISARPGGGTRVRVLLPCHSEHTPAATSVIRPIVPPPTPPIPGRPGDYQVLIVDDEAQVLNVARTVLHEEGGYGVTCARDGLEAVELLTKDPGQVDLVLLDMIMPRMGGLEALQEIRRIRRDLPVIITTGYGNEAQMQAVRAAGAVGVLSKPYAPEDLLRSVSKALIRG
jgi:signal transduction histidine kinase